METGEDTNTNTVVVTYVGYLTESDAKDGDNTGEHNGMQSASKAEHGQGSIPCARALARVQVSTPVRQRNDNG